MQMSAQSGRKTARLHFPCMEQTLGPGLRTSGERKWRMLVIPDEESSSSKNFSVRGGNSFFSHHNVARLVKEVLTL